MLQWNVIEGQSLVMWFLESVTRVVDAILEESKVQVNMGNKLTAV